VKHIIHAWRNIIMTIVQIFTPVLFTILACLIVKTMPSVSDPPARVLSLHSFPDVIVPYRLQDHLTTLAQDYIDTVHDQVGDDFITTVIDFRITTIRAYRLQDHLTTFAQGYIDTVHEQVGDDFITSV
jgi:hypothetical protein